MAKQYTYDPRKMQGGGYTPQPAPPQATISQGPSRWDNIKSDVRSFIKYPMKSLRTMNQIGYLPYNFDKGVESGQVTSQPMDFAVDMLNIPGTVYKGMEYLDKGDMAGAGMTALSMLPFAKPLKSMGLNPTTAKAMSKAINKGSKGISLQMQDGGTAPRQLPEAQIRAEIARLNEALAAEQSRIAQFQQNVQGQLPNYQTNEELLSMPGNQKAIDSTEVIGNTYNWLDSRYNDGDPNTAWYGCTSYGCGIMRDAGATLQGDINIAGRDYSAGDKLPIIAGNAMMNSLIEQNPAAMGFEVINPQSYDDLQPGDRVVSSYDTRGGEGGQHTMIFSGEYDDYGDPIMMENAGGKYMRGISSQAKGFDFTGGDDDYRITRYTGNTQNLNNELANYQNMLDSGNFIPTPTAVSTISPLGIKDLAPLQPPTSPPDLLEQRVMAPTMQSGGFTMPYFNQQDRRGRLQGRADKYGVDITGMSNKEAAVATRGARMDAFNNSAMGKMSGNMGMLGSLASGFVLSGGDGTYDPGAAGLAGGLAGAGTGAQMGAALGPVGMAVGAILGGVGGAIFGKEKAKKAERQRKEKKEDMLAANVAAGKTNDEARSAGVLSQYPTEGITSSYYAKYGGMMGTPDYVVEGGELMMAPNNNPPKTDNNGRVTQIGKNMFKFEGDTHDAPSGGIGVQGGNSEFASQTNQVLDSGFVFSDRLKANPDDYLKNI